MKNFLNGIESVFCVLVLCVFAGCSAPNDVPEKITVMAPVFSVSDEAVDYGDKITLSCEFSGAEIFYTLDGTVPSKESTKYENPVTITKAVTIKAIAVKAGMNDSEVSEKSYTVKTYTVTFDANGHGTAPDSITGKHKGETIKIPSGLQEAGLLFTYWNDGTRDYGVGEDYTVTGDVTIKATWIDNTAPGVVKNLSPSCEKSQTIKLTWTNPTDEDFEKVEISYGEGNKVTVLKSAEVNNAAIISGLTNGTLYIFSVKTYDTSGNASSPIGTNATPRVCAVDYNAGTKPADITGSNAQPEFSSPIQDHLYLSQSSAGIKAKITTSNVKEASKYQWYTGTDGKWEKLTESGTSNALTITVVQGITYYLCEAINGNSITYSNICTVECGTGKTEKIGYISYSDGTFSQDYNSNKTPDGIVFDVDASGNPSRIVNLIQLKQDIKWCISGTEASSKTFTTLSPTDGSGNWKIICDNVSDEGTSGNYPAFEYCNSMGEGWYLPSRDELTTLCFNKKAVDATVKLLNQYGVSAVSFENNIYWSSYASTTSPNYAWFVSFTAESQGTGGKTGGNRVRAIKKVQ
ncbi:MAG: chitobiase/beta-hexosaminidase C-terminal domain-containing protein [Treponema sp.]|nr:chitobiase/beta-hexosaminidase C-terminal domain-containing protein [Candidatus Treponema merdequi]